MRRAAEGLPRAPEVVGEHLGDKYPDNGALADGVRGDKQKQENRHGHACPLQNKGGRHQR